MAMEYTQIPADIATGVQFNAGVLFIDDSFNPTTSTEVSRDKIIGATSGGINVSCVPTYVDFGEDIDNCPKNSMELKVIDGWEIKISGTFVSMDLDLAKKLLGCTVDTSKSSYPIAAPTSYLSVNDFISTLWWAGDYSATDAGAGGGSMIIGIDNALSTGGFVLQSSDKAKGTVSFEFTAHYSLDEPENVPFMAWIQKASESAT